MKKFFQTTGRQMAVLTFTTATVFAAESWMLPLGSQAPDFELPDVVTGEMVSLSDFSDKDALLVMFLCRGCPFVKHVQKEVAEIGRDYADASLGIVAISANDISRFPQDAPESLKEMALEEGFTFPYLYDESQEAAKAYTGVYTPDFFLFSAEGGPASGGDVTWRLVYRGQLDGSRPNNNEPVTGKDLRGAMDALLAGKPVNTDQTPSFGCSIKWKEGNRPTYLR